MFCGLCCNVFSRKSGKTRHFYPLGFELCFQSQFQKPFVQSAEDLNPFQRNHTRSPAFVMKSKKNLTRFTYENAAFEGWRLCISRAGTTFTKYFPDKKYGGVRKSLSTAETALSEIREILNSAKRVNGKLTQITIRKVEAILEKV
jgi:hypothetical protein